jgi:hypothetical protein
MNGKTWTIFAAATVAALAGCQQNTTIDTGSGAPREANAPAELVAQLKPPVPDIPLPLGFDIDQGNSRSSAGGGFRLVDYKFDGRPDKWAVGRFYKRQMPANRWTLETDNMIGGSIYLLFTNGKEYCNIVISDNPWWKLFKPTRIALDIHPSGKLERPVDR